MVEADILVKGDNTGIAALYVVASLFLGLVAVYLGIVAAATWLTAPRRRDEARRSRGTPHDLHRGN